MMRCPIFFVVSLYCVVEKNKFYFPLAVLRLDIGGFCLHKIPKIDVFFEMWGDLQERVERQGKKVKITCIGHNFVVPNFQVSNWQCLFQIKV